MPEVTIQDDRIIVRRYASRDRLVARRGHEGRYWIFVDQTNRLDSRIELGYLSRAALRGLLRDWGVPRRNRDEFLGKVKATS